MKLAVPKETWPGERRVAATPDTVKKLIALGFEVVVEKGAGLRAAITDARFIDAGATIAENASQALADADLVFKVRPPREDDTANELKDYPKGASLVCLLDPYDSKDLLVKLAKSNIDSFAMELMPRISRAQSMDVLSSQSNLSGYRAVIEAAHKFGRIFPMMMTAAGTVAPARVVVVGAGVAGLQAIATARRLGGVVSAFDVRPVAKEQVESLGASFIEVEDESTGNAETSGGYAREMSEEYRAKQAALLKDVLAKTDIVITTALIPGRPAPEIVTADMVAGMKAGSVIVDLAAERGGNVAGIKCGETIETDNGVFLIGAENITSAVAGDAASMYARNLLNFITLSVDKEKSALNFDANDQIIAETCLTRDGKIVHPNFSEPEENLTTPVNASESDAPQSGETESAPEMEGGKNG